MMLLTVSQGIGLMASFWAPFCLDQHIYHHHITHSRHDLFSFFLIFKKYIFIYLAVPGLSCGMEDFPSSVWQGGSFIMECGICSCCM